VLGSLRGFGREMKLCAMAPVGGELSCLGASTEEASSGEGWVGVTVVTCERRPRF
jgi:hypothetical protein